MIKTTLLVTFILFISSFNSFGQLYEKIYEQSSSEIQNKIDQNKISGIDILTGINAKHIIGIAGIGTSQKSNLEQLLNSIPSLISFVLSDDFTSIVIESKPSFNMEEFTLKINSLNGILTGHSTTYYIND